MKRSYKILYLFGSSVLLFSIVPILLQDAIGIKINEKFLTYRNPKLGFKISYPSSWHAIEENNNRVIFNSFGIATVRIIEDNASMIENCSSAIDVTAAHHYAMKDTNSLQGIARNVRVTSVSVGIGHLPGWSVDYFILPGHHIIDTFLIMNCKIFTISYVMTTANAAELLTIMKLMLGSFQLVK